MRSFARAFLIAGAILTTGAAAQTGWNEQKDDTMYTVIVNHEEQYSIWLADRELPPDWEKVSHKPCLKSDCLDCIEEVWTDMRPLSLKRHMDIAEREKETGFDSAQQLALGRQWYAHYKDAAERKVGGGGDQIIIVSADGYIIARPHGYLPLGDWRSTGLNCSPEVCWKVIVSVLLKKP